MRARVGGLFAVCANLACIYVCAHECMRGLHVSVCVPASHTLRGALAEQAVEQAIQAGVLLATHKGWVVKGVGGEAPADIKGAPTPSPSHAQKLGQADAQHFAAASFSSNMSGGAEQSSQRSGGRRSGGGEGDGEEDRVSRSGREEGSKEAAATWSQQRSAVEGFLATGTWNELGMSTLSSVASTDSIGAIGAPGRLHQPDMTPVCVKLRYI